MTARPVRAAAAAAAVALAVLTVSSAHATSLSAPINLAQLVHDASVIVSGTVTDVRTDTTGPIAHVEISLEVQNPIRGAGRGAFTFRQIALPAPGPVADGRRYVGILPGVPQYTRGEHVLLFLGRETSAGLRTTVGLGQGKFLYAAGNLQNENANRGLFKDVTLGRTKAGERESAMLSTQKGVVDAGTFVSLLERGVAQNWWGSPTATPGNRGGLDGSTTSLSRTSPVRR